jgi:hypothetical protein
MAKFDTYRCDKCGNEGTDVADFATFQLQCQSLDPSARWVGYSRKIDLCCECCRILKLPMPTLQANKDEKERIKQLTFEDMLRAIVLDAIDNAGLGSGS